MDAIAPAAGPAPGPDTYRWIFDHAAAGLAHVALDGRFLAVNDRFCAIAGQPREALLATTYQRITHPDDLATDEAQVEALRAGRIPSYAMKKRYLRPDGSAVWIQLTGSVIRAGDGTPHSFVAVIEDITAQVHATQARDEALRQLREHEALLRQVLHSAPDPVWTKDLAGRWTLLNPAALAVIGKPSQALLGQRDEDVLPAALADIVGREDERILRHGEQLSVEETLPDASRGGDIRVFLTTKAPLRDSNGTIVGLLGIARDITERKAAEEAMRIAAVAFDAEEGLGVTDGRCIVLRVNRALCRLTGYDAEGLIGRDSTVLMAHDTMPMSCGSIREIIGRDGRWQGEVICRRRDDSTFPAWLSATAVRDAAGHTTHHVIALTDISLRKSSEAALLKTQRELAQLAQQLMLQEQQTTRRLAQLLHDGLGQTLGALRLHAEMLMAGGGPNLLPEPLRPHGQAALDLISRAVDEVRGALVAWRPPLLESQGLVAALDNELQLRQRDAGATVLHLSAAAALLQQRWPAEVEHAFFMVAREAVGNALQHAAATRIECRLDGDARWLWLLVRDDGNGLLVPGEHAGHLGLVGLRERALGIGARVKLQGRRGKGSRVELEWEADARAITSAARMSAGLA